MKALGRALKPHPRNSIFELSGSGSRLACNRSVQLLLSVEFLLLSLTRRAADCAPLSGGAALEEAAVWGAKQMEAGEGS